MISGTELVSPIDFYKAAKFEVFRHLEESPDSVIRYDDYDSFIFVQDIQPFVIKVAGVEIDAIDIDTAKFIDGTDMCKKEDHSRIFFGLSGKFKAETVRLVSQGDEQGGYMYLMCGGERLPTLIPRYDLQNTDSYANGTELNTEQCTRFIEILRSLKLFPEKK